MMITMIARTPDLCRRLLASASAALAACLLMVPAAAQELEKFDPDQAYAAQDAAPAGGIDADLAAPGVQPAAPTEP
ncbi:MAG: DUF1134 domain-containing protein, partial [Erythrobacter sp.]|nr:DUF1134 domain-containing protein [Erythrobacter sp.]